MENDMNLVPHFKVLIEWAKQGLEASPNIPSNIYRYMKLKEALEEAFESITCVEIMEGLQKSSQQQENGFRLVVDNDLPNKLLRRPNQIKVNLPML
jgi:hypothetical protein